MDHGTLEEIRKMAIERVREGERPSEVIPSYGFHRCVIYRWMKAAAGRGKGLKSMSDEFSFFNVPPVRLQRFCGQTLYRRSLIRSARIIGKIDKKIPLNH